MKPTATKRTGIIKDARYLQHLTDENHPENHRRLETIYNALAAPGMRDLFVEIPPRLAKEEELLLVHAPEHVEKIAATAGATATALTPDTIVSAGSYLIARLAVGGVFTAIDEVVGENLSSAFALVRPPGHHAEKSRAMGFCLFNNVALGAAYACKRFGLERILIVDWDVHHGNGTQHIFEADNRILFASVHQYPHFPGTGSFTEVGIGAGEGFTINIAIPKGYGDGEYVAIFETLIKPLALEFQPELILVSAGFDVGSNDPLGGMQLTPAGYAGLTRCLMETAEMCCDGKLVLVLEGGYDISSIGAAVTAVVQELSGGSLGCNAALAAKARPKKVLYALKRSIKVHRRFWKCLAEPVEIRCSKTCVWI